MGFDSFESSPTYFITHNLKADDTVIQGHVTKSFGFVKTTAIGGLIFLLPLIVVGALLGQVIPMVVSIAKAMADFLPPAVQSAGGIALLVILALAFILLACFAAGVVARWSLGKRLSAFIEKNVLFLFPRYGIIREQVAGSMSGHNEEMRLRPVLVLYCNVRRIAFEVDRYEGANNGLVSIYLPGSPDVWSGCLVHMKPDEVEPLNVDFSAACTALEQLGRGSGALLAGYDSSQ